MITALTAAGDNPRDAICSTYCDTVILFGIESSALMSRHVWYSVGRLCLLLSISQGLSNAVTVVSSAGNLSWAVQAALNLGTAVLIALQNSLRLLKKEC